MKITVRNLYTLASFDVKENITEVASRRLAKTATTALIPSNLQAIGGVHVPIKVGR